jgi:hypothetical protein
MGVTILSLYSHFLHGGQKLFLLFAIFPHFYSVRLNSFPDTLLLFLLHFHVLVEFISLFFFFFFGGTRA